VVAIQYTDYSNTYTRDNFQNMLFGTWSSGSAKDYYAEVSYDSISMEGTVYPTSGSWYTAANNRAYYGYDNGFVRAAELAKEAAQTADASINYADFDDNDDGEVDLYTVLHAGYGREESGSGDDIHSHSWSFTGAGIGAYTTADPWPGHSGQYITVNAYTIDPERSGYSNNGTMVCIGVFCHEWGHSFGLPDLYSTTGEGNGLGNWTLMASGAWGGDGASPWKPAHLDAWCKSDLGWLAFRNIDHNGIRDVYAVEDSAVAYRVWTEGSSSAEFFVVENRQKIGFDTTLANSGLLIYHLDTTLIHNRRNNNDIQQYTTYGIDIEDADGLNHIYLGDNRGDGGDPYQGSTNNTAFDSTGTNPDSRNNSGANTHCGVNTISASVMSMTAFFYISSDVQPDNLVKNSADSTYKGADIYEADPTDTQTVEQTLPRGNTATYHVKIENDGAIPETYMVTGPADTSTANADWTIAYYDAYTGGTDITAEVTGTGWFTDFIDPDDSVRIRVEVTPDPTAQEAEVLDVVVESSTTGYSTDLLDAVKAVTTVGPDVFQADGQIKISTESVWLGDDVYNLTGAGQTASQTRPAGQTAIYHLRIQNDSGDPDVLMVTGTAGNVDWTVTYYDALTAGTDRTSHFTGMGWSTDSLNVGAYRDVRVEVTPAASLASGISFDVDVTSVTYADSTGEDMVKAVTTVDESGIAELDITGFALEVIENRVYFALPRSTQVSLNVYDVTGRGVAALASGQMESGSYTATWSAPHGVYFVKFLTPEFSAIRKVVIVN
jgi:M6 family metalloprotease-like protein